MSSAAYNPDPDAHPGLHLIALFEGVKGVLALAVAAGLVVLGPARLRDALHALVQRFLPQAEPGTMTRMLDTISPGSVHVAAGVILLYALLRLLEAWGLWRARAWASWLGCLGSAAYLPLDLYALYRHPGWHTWALLIVNVLIVLVLWRDIVRRRRI